MKTLLAGYRKFRSETWPHERGAFAELAKGQKPQTLVIACSDSRVDPTTIFSARAGELFVVRNVAAIVPPYDTAGGYHGVSAAIAFAVVNLEVVRIVVLGHEHCGGIAAARSDGAKTLATPFLSQWVSLLEPAIGGGKDQLGVEHESIRLSLERLKTFPFIAERVDAGALQLIGVHFKISDGTLWVLDPGDRRFHRAEEETSPADGTG